jgi:hypothetical protein
MLKVLTKSVNEHEDFMNNCVNNYIEELSKEFINNFVKRDSTINDLEKGYIKFSKSVNDYVEFKHYCKQIASMKKLNIKSKLFQKSFQNHFTKMKKQFGERYYLKNYTNKCTKLGKQYTKFLIYCRKLYMKDIFNEYFYDANIDSLESNELDNLYDLYSDSVKDQQKFKKFCEKINSYFAKEKQLDLNCNLYKVYFEDHYYIMINMFH